MRGAVLAVHDREGFAPVTLAGEQPVAQTVAHGALADTGTLQPGVDLGDGIIHAQTVKAQRVALGFGGLDGGVDHDAVMGNERRLALVVGEVIAGFRQRFNGVDDRKTELGGEIVITLVATRHGHNGTGAVVHQHVVGGEQRELRAGDRVGGVQAGEQTCLLAAFVHAVLGGLGFGGEPVGLHRLDRVDIAALPVFGYIGRPFGGHVLQQVMFRGNNGERGAEQRVGTGGVDFHVLVTVGSGHGEVHGGAMGFTDPVALHELDLLRPVDAVKVGDQTVAVLGDAHGPLTELTLEDREVATLGLAFGGDLLVGQHGAQTRAPVDRGLGDVRQTEVVQDILLLGGSEVGPLLAIGLMARNVLFAGFELGHELGDRACGALGAGRVGGLLVVPGIVDAREDPLGPTHVAGVDGGERAAVVEAQAHAVQLAAHVGDVRLGGHARMLTGLDRVLFRGQAEGVIAHGVQDVLALHAVVAARHIGGQIAQRVAHMQTLAGGVREHVHGEVGGAAFGVTALAVLQIAVDVGGPEGALLVPNLLPLVFDVLRQCGVVAEVGLFGLRALLVVTHKSAG